MSRETAAETVAVVLTLGILASPVRAEPVKLIRKWITSPQGRSALLGGTLTR
jgi:hypothetical protein